MGCDVLAIPGLGRLDLGDVVPWNVARSLELTSGGQFLGLARDARKNVRLAVSSTGMDTAAFRHLDHRAIDGSGHGAVEFAAAWLVEVLEGHEAHGAARRRRASLRRWRERTSAGAGGASCARVDGHGRMLGAAP